VVSLSTEIIRAGFIAAGRGRYTRAGSVQSISLTLNTLQWKGRISATLGLRHREADEFGRQMLRRYGAQIYQSIGADEVAWCQIDLALLAGNGEQDLTVAFSRSDAQVRIINVLRSAEFGLLMQYDDLALTRMLEADEPPCRWFRSNGAARLAQLYFLTARLGLPSSPIDALAVRHRKQITSDLGSSRDSDFVAACPTEAQAWCGRTL
jgi:hypothetical protein